MTTQRLSCRRPTLLQRAVAVLVILSLHALQAASAADLSQQMASMFGNGALANVTGPGAYRAQTQNIYTGGEMQLRFPARTYQLYSFQLPHITAGCGGVDLFMGSFSHISSDKFKEMLEAVAQSFSGLLFKAALKSINPLIESVIGDLQKTLESVSQYSNNACAMAEALMEQTSAATGMTAQNSCVRSAMAVFGDDLPKAQARCKVPGGAEATNAAAKASNDPNVAAMADRDINLIWQALSGSTLNRQEKEVFMNIAGTVLIYKPANNGEKPKTPQPYEPAVDSLATMLHGHQAGANASQVVVKNWISCPDADCMAPQLIDKTITPFPVLARQMLESIRDRLINRQALAANEIQFVNMTRVPVYRLMAAGYSKDSASGAQDLVDILIDRYANVVAYDYAYTFMRVALRDARLYVSMAAVQNRVEQTQRDAMIANVNRLMEEIDREHSKALARVREARSLIDDLQAIERDMRLSMPTSIRNMQDISNLLRGGRG